MLWEIDIYPISAEADRPGLDLAAAAGLLGLAGKLQVHTARGYLLEGLTDEAQANALARRLLADAVTERVVVGQVGSSQLSETPNPATPTLVHVLPKPAVMDPVALSVQQAAADLGFPLQAVRTLKKYWLSTLPQNELELLCKKLLSNEAIEEWKIGPLELERLELGSSYEFQPLSEPLDDLGDERFNHLSLSRAELETIQAHFRELGRDPTDAELETIAQTWSEHCSHKTLAGRIAYRDPQRELNFENMLKETIFAATQDIRASLGENDWCVSVFQDNAGVVRFDDKYNVVFKVETHNHPSALEPYGGANTGIGGVIRDPMGTGLGAKPVCNTDVFCFAPPTTPFDTLPEGVLHPQRVMQGVVSGVRDYGNRMGIPTVNGAIYFDDRYLGNPLVYCGNVGLLPRDKSHKEPKPGDLVVVIGGRTGRDGIHGATFSSAELHSESDTTSSGAVQIGNAITEKMVLDALLQARDEGLFTAVTDCGAGGLSSAVGEMGEKIGAEVDLDLVPLKYAGLSYTEIWISEAQERMVFSVSPDKWPRFKEVCDAEGVEATAIGTYVPTGRLTLRYQGNVVADLSMHFLHDGRPPVIRQANYQPPPRAMFRWSECGPARQHPRDYTNDLRRILSSLNVCSKHWVIRQYDHEVQGGSIVKPLVGVENDGPGDAAVVRPVLGSRKALVISCGMNPYYGDLDPYHMAASAIDEAVRNAVASGADPARIAILDNFCWGNTEKPEQLGSLVRAALACHDVAVGLQTPFISGKDSLNNEFRFKEPDAEKKSISIPASLLISAMGQMDDASKAVTMDLKRPGNLLYQVGVTKAELGGSHFALIHKQRGAQVPQVDVPRAKKTFAALHAAINAGLVRSCHDMSEGGLATAVAEMAFAGGLGAQISLSRVPHEIEPDSEALEAARHWSEMNPGNEALHPLVGMPQAAALLLFSESNTRFLCEVPAGQAEAFEKALDGVPCQLIGEVTSNRTLEILGLPVPAVDQQDSHAPTAPLVIRADIDKLKEAWQTPLNW